MWGRKPTPTEETAPPPKRLREALRQVRVEAAERSSVVVDLRDAEVARLDALNEVLDPVFKEIPADVELFDRGLTHGDPARLWIDVVCFVAMARDKRTYRLVQETRNGRVVLAESADVEDIAEATTTYIARRLVERERALASDERNPGGGIAYDTGFRWRRRWPAIRTFVLGLFFGFAALLAALWMLASRG